MSIQDLLNDPAYRDETGALKDGAYRAYNQAKARWSDTFAGCEDITFMLFEVIASDWN